MSVGVFLSGVGDGSEAGVSGGFVESAKVTRVESPCMVVHLSRQFCAEHEFRQHAVDLLWRCAGVTLLYAARGEHSYGLVQPIQHGEFFPGGHASNEFDLQGFHLRMGIGKQRAHKLIISRT